MVGGWRGERGVAGIGDGSGEGWSVGNEGTVVRRLHGKDSLRESPPVGLGIYTGISFVAAGTQLDRLLIDYYCHEAHRGGRRFAKGLCFSTLVLVGIVSAAKSEAQPWSADQRGGECRLEAAPGFP